MSFLGAQNSIALGVQGIIAIDTGTGGGAASYNLDKSLRFRSSASAYLNRTAGTPTAQTKYTISVWVKRGTSTFYSVFSAGSASANDYDSVQFNSASTLAFFTGPGAGTADLVTTQLFRDFAAWYHIIVAVDTTQATASNRVKIYVNGAQVTSFSTATYPSLNGASAINRSGAVQAIGALYSGSYNQYLDGELAEFNFIDGQQLAPTAFGAYSIYNQWLPIAYAGTYGTNGFYLPFTNTTSTSTLVADSSGNANNWTPNNISLTAGSTYDSLTDVPTLTSTTVANYAVYTPLATVVTGGGTALATLTNGNLTASSAAANFYDCFSSFNIPATGKWYFEWSVTTVGTNHYLGIASRLSWTAASRLYQNNGDKIINGTSSAYGATYTSSDVIGCAIDMDAGTLVMYKNNATQGTLASDLVSAAPATGWCVVAEMRGTAAHSINFGQQPFVYTAPSGFLPLNTFNI